MCTKLAWQDVQERKGEYFTVFVSVAFFITSRLVKHVEKTGGTSQSVQTCADKKHTHLRSFFVQRRRRGVCHEKFLEMMLGH